MTSEALSFRPYARLLTMLGDQLIKNERIALVELIKNAYDADADQVEIRFEDFNEDMTSNPDSHIIVRDNGTGMTFEAVRNQWMNPASPNKFLDKGEGRGKTPLRRRVMQGEKGIGRFAILKLGKLSTVTTRSINAEHEIKLRYDFSRYDDDFLSENETRKEIFLDQIKIHCSQSKPTVLPYSQHGTEIQINALKGTWSAGLIKAVCRDVSDLTDPISRISGRKKSDQFDIAIYCNGQRRSVGTDRAELLRSLIDEKPVLKIEGCFDSAENLFSFQTGLDNQEILLNDPSITGLWVWRERFGRGHANSIQEQAFVCGGFYFHFYIFDFSRGISGKHALNQTEKDLLKQHRIYLYRDGVRVYPYGDPDDDWLSMDVTRGIGRAGNFFSNAQIVGWIDITHEGNPNLRDKTNREGLIETGGAASDLIFLVQIFLSYLKQHHFARHQQEQRRRHEARRIQDGRVETGLTELQQSLAKEKLPSQAHQVSTLAASYEREKSYLLQRAEMIEDLAGVGLSVEMASHDIMLLMNRAKAIGRHLAEMARAAGVDGICEQSDTLLAVLEQIGDGMQDLQILFKSSRRRRKIIIVESVLEKIHKIYGPLLAKSSIRYRTVKLGGPPLTASTTDGVIMQVLINLFDNASYWLDSIEPEKREIQVTLDGQSRELIFSDNGPGIDPEDLPYIFEPFYSGKGKEGRGLGLYIARQLLERHGHRIGVARKRHESLPGANFVIRFARKEA